MMPYMGIPPRLQRAFNRMLDARSHIELGKAYQDSASEIIKVRNSGSFDDVAMHELFKLHNSIYERTAQRFPCAPKTTGEAVQLDNMLLSATVNWGWSKGWIEWELVGRRPKSISDHLKESEKQKVLPIISRWIHCEYIKPDGRGGYVMGEEGRRLQSALMVSKGFPDWALGDMI